jgi:hypothetical protein
VQFLKFSWKRIRVCDSLTSTNCCGGNVIKSVTLECHLAIVVIGVWFRNSAGLSPVTWPRTWRKTKPTRRLCSSSTFTSGRQSFETEFREHHHFDIDLAIAVAAAQLQPTMALESGETPRRMSLAPLASPSEQGPLTDSRGDPRGDARCEAPHAIPRQLRPSADSPQSVSLRDILHAVEVRGTNNARPSPTEALATAGATVEGTRPTDAVCRRTRDTATRNANTSSSRSGWPR